MKYIDYTIFGASGMDLFLAIVMMLITVAGLAFLSFNVLQAWQLGGYRLKEFKVWYKKYGYTVFFRYCFLSFLICLGCLMYISALGDRAGWKYLGFAFFLVLGYIFFKIIHKNDVTPLKWTPRMWRLLCTCVVLYIILVLLFSFIPTGVVEYAHLGLLPLAIIPVVILADFINSPFEKSIQRDYINKAKQKIAEIPHLKIIGITGSYGKTTTKNILHSLLSTHLKVCSSPASFNTPMGICKTINNDLKHDDHVLILEMGARYKGDILELLEIVEPHIVVITSVGNQHIQTFGNYETVLATKLDILSKLPHDGVAVLDGTNMDIRAAATNMRQAILVGTDMDYVKSSNIVIHSGGTQFDLTVGNSTVTTSTQLLGRHIPHLVALSIAVANVMGFDLNQIVHQIPSIAPVPHRMQLMPGSTDNIIIDNSYSSNLDGAKNALEVLSSYANFLKIIITPGIVEQGDLEEKTNTILGTEIAKTCDYAILVGSKAPIIKKGIEQTNIHTTCISVENRAEAINALKDISGKRVVLFENDLPDNIK